MRGVKFLALKYTFCVFSIKNKQTKITGCVCHRQPDGLVLWFKCPGDLVGSHVHPAPDMFWFESTLGTLLLVTLPVTI